jgi:hypothetical protein
LVWKSEASLFLERSCLAFIDVGEQPASPAGQPGPRLQYQVQADNDSVNGCVVYGLADDVATSSAFSCEVDVSIIDLKI